MKPQLWMHTPKAVKAGNPADRVFLVVDVAGSEPGDAPEIKGHLVAWKCTLTSEGLEHPAFYDYKRSRIKGLLTLTAAGIKMGNINGSANNGSEPTALFKPDSFYRQVTVADLKKLAAKMSESEPEQKVCKCCGRPR